MNDLINDRNSECGGAGVKILMALLIIILLSFAGFNFIPVVYQGMSLRQEMETAVVQGSVVPMLRKTPIEAVRHHLANAANAAGIPENSLIEAKQVGNTLQGRISYSRDVSILPFGLYTYTYTFDYTAVPNGYVAKK